MYRGRSRRVDGHPGVGESFICGLGISRSGIVRQINEATMLIRIRAIMVRVT